MIPRGDFIENFSNILYITSNSEVWHKKLLCRKALIHNRGQQFPDIFLIQSVCHEPIFTPSIMEAFGRGALITSVLSPMGSRHSLSAEMEESTSRYLGNRKWPKVIWAVLGQISRQLIYKIAAFRARDQWIHILFPSSSYKKFEDDICMIFTSRYIPLPISWWAWAYRNCSLFSKRFFIFSKRLVHMWLLTMTFST